MSGNKDYRDILFCSDFSDDAHYAFLHVIEQCRKNRSQLHILHTVISPETYTGPMIDHSLNISDITDVQLKKEKIKEQAVLALRLEYEPKLKEIAEFKFVVRFGSPDVQIIKYSKEHHIDLIVLGVMGRTGNHKGRMLKTAANVSKYAPCQVVTIGISR